MTKHDAMKAYFEPKVEELVGDLLNFNFSPESPDSIAMITNYSDKVRKKYIRCGSEKEYGFTILIAKTYSSEQDDLNLEAMNFCQAFYGLAGGSGPEEELSGVPGQLPDPENGMPPEHAEPGRSECRRGACAVYDPVQDYLF